jgi:K+-sensing histidine kinase KdpD
MNQKTEQISLTRIINSMKALLIVFGLTVLMSLIGPKMLGEGVIALLYLIPIGWCTVKWGQIAGVSAALTAALSFDFLFIPPYGTFNIGSLEGWLLLVLFIGISILVIGRIQDILLIEKNRVRKATFLYEMVAAIARQQTREGIVKTIGDQIQQKYLPKHVQVHLNGTDHLLPIIMVDDHITNTIQYEKPDRILPIVSGPASIGEIALWKGLVPLPEEDDQMFQTFLMQTAFAIDRVQKNEEK